MDFHSSCLVFIRYIPLCFLHLVKEQKALSSLNIAQAQALMENREFEEGTMLPKIEAAVSYLDVNKNGSVLITSLESVSAALKGKAGTIITA